MTNPYETPSGEPENTTDAGDAVSHWRRQVLSVDFLLGAFLVGIPCEIWLALNFLHPRRGWILAAAMMAGGLARVFVRRSWRKRPAAPVSFGEWCVCLIAALVWVVFLPEAVDPQPYEKFRQRLQEQLRERESTHVRSVPPCSSVPISELSVVKKEPCWKCRGDLTTEDAEEAWRATEGYRLEQLPTSSRSSTP